TGTFNITGNSDHANTDTDVENLVLINIAEVLHHLQQSIRHAVRVSYRAVFKQQAKLISAKTGQGIVLTNALAQEQADLLQQTVSCAMATGIVNHLELVKIHITEYVVGILFMCAFQEQIQAALEFVPVNQPGQG